ncbi:MAG: lectin-like protein, partial [Gammaproteobacteria bacterium]
VATTTDALGGTTEFTSAGQTIANVNDAPTGTPSITGTATQGQTLTANTSGISDADGLGAFSYVWKANGVVITGATSSTLVLTQAQVGKAITVEVSYTDAQSTVEGPLVSAATTPIANVNDAPTGAVTITGTPTQGQTLSVSHTLADADGLGAITYRWFASGSATAIGTGSSYVLTQAEVGKTISVVASYMDGFGAVESVTGTLGSRLLTASDITNSATQRYNSANGHIYEYVSTSQTWAQAKTLAATKSISGAVGYLVTITSAQENDFIVSSRPSNGASEYWIGASDGEAEGTWRWVTGPETGEQFWQGAWTGAAFSGRYANWGTGEPNDNFLNDGIDEDGALIGTALGWEAGKWNDGWVAHQLAYIVEYGDVRAVVANVNDIPTGTPGITGTLRKSETLTAVTTGVADADGLGSFSYVWKADGTAIA